MSTEVKKRFDFSNLSSKMTQMECEDFVREHKLEGQVKKEHFLLPELTHIQVLQRMLEEDADHSVIHDETLAAIAQRMIWMANEIGSLKRTNRNLRSKNLRLKRALNPDPRLVLTPEMKQILLKTKHLERSEPPVHYPVVAQLKGN